MSKLKLLAICPDSLPVLAKLRRVRSLDLTVATDMAAIAAAAATAEVILYSSLAGGTPPFPAVWPHTSPHLRWIHSFETGVDRLLSPEVVASVVTVTNARGVYAPPLAEFVVFGILFFYKQTRRLLASQAAHQWDQHEVQSLAGKRLGVVGYGGVGRACALACHRLGMRIHVMRRRPELSLREREVERAYAPSQLHAMLAGVDVLLAAAPLTPGTRHLIDGAALAALRPSALVVNVGRGPVIDEDALVAALRERRIAGAALDVFEREPLAADHLFWAMDNVLISPHCTDRTVDPHWTDLGMQCFLDNLRRYRRGLPLENIVDKSAGY